MDYDSTIRESKRDGFLDYLVQTSMKPELHIPCRRSVLKVDSGDLIPSVMRRLSSEGFSSAPVMEDGDFVGFIEMMDLVRYVTGTLFWGATEPAWSEFWSNHEVFAKTTVGTVMESRRTRDGKLRKARYSALDDKCFENDSTLHALEIMVKGDIHRLGILNDRFSRRLTGIFTQSMMISEIRQRLHLLGELKTKSVASLTSWWSDIKTVRETERAINAFNLMAEQSVTGLAVVDTTGVLVDAISVTDLKAVGNSGKSFWKLFESVKDFKEYSRAHHPFVAPAAHYSTTPTPKKFEPVFVTNISTFEDVLIRMEDGNIHRVFVCTEASARAGRPIPTHVITQTDVLKYILQHYTWSF